MWFHGILPLEGLGGVDGGVLRVGAGGSIAGSWSTAWDWGQVGLAAEEVVLGAGRGRDGDRSGGSTVGHGSVRRSSGGCGSGIGCRCGRLGVATSVG